MGKKTVAVIFGGQSSEHVVSCMSVVNIIGQIDKEQYELLLIGITQEGKWIYTESVETISSGEWKNGQTQAVVLPDATKRCVLLLSKEGVSERRIDVAFPVLHGILGEDGSIQGLFELAKIPYVGCGVLASAVSMDKLYTKIIVDGVGILQAKFVPVMKEELCNMEQVINQVEGAFDYPVFVKPSKAGSSKGVAKANSRRELEEALQEAALFDRKILVEETIVGREVECAVFGGGVEEIEVSGVGEILAAAQFYDFEAKYYNEESKTVMNPLLPDGAKERIQDAAKKIFRAVDGYGLSRVDFFIKENGEIIFNEINTMPGFTAISMYPMLFEEAGVTKKELVKRLLAHAIYGKRG